MTAVELDRKKVNFDKLLSFGFVADGDGYVYHTDLINRQMDLTVQINSDGKLYTTVTDRDNGEEYVLHRVSGATGAFVGQVRKEYEAVIEEIMTRCFDPEVFKSNQTKTMLAYVLEKYGDEPEYLWKKFPSNAVVRRKDNRKWYAVILRVSQRKLGLESDEWVEILDFRWEPWAIEQTVDSVRYFPGYHMNKKHWITVCLDDTVPNEELFARIDHSYVLAKR